MTRTCLQIFQMTILLHYLRFREGVINGIEQQASYLRSNPTEQEQEQFKTDCVLDFKGRLKLTMYWIKYSTSKLFYVRYKHCISHWTQLDQRLTLGTG